MFPLTLDTTIVSLFLLTNVGVGLWYARGVRTVREYAVGDKKFPTWILTLTIVATWLSGSSFANAITSMYKNGFWGLGIYIARGAALCFIGWFVSLRMGEFLKHLSAAEAMGSLYGRRIRGFMAVISLWACVAMVAFQLEAAGLYLHELFQWDIKLAKVGIAILLIFYTSLGGIRSVTFTDALQFLFLGLFLPMFLLVLWYNKPNEAVPISSILKGDIFSTGSIFKSPYSFFSFIFCGFLPRVLNAGLMPAVFQRAQMGRSVYQVRRSFLYAALIWFVIVFVLFGISVLFKSHGIDPTQGNMWQKFTDGTLGLSIPTGFRGLVACAILSMAMSTADSYGQAGGVNVHDLFSVIGYDTKKTMVLVRWGTVLIGMVALTLALLPDSWRNEFYNWDSPMYNVLVATPLLMALFGFRSTAKVMGISLVVGLMITIGWQWWVVSKFDVLSNSGGKLTGLLLMPIIMSLVHYLFGDGKWKGIQEDEPLRQARLLRAERWRAWKSSWQSFDIWRWLETQQPNSLSTYFFVGLYGLVTVLIMGFGMPADIVTKQSAFLFGSLFCGLLAATALMTYPGWPLFMRSQKMRLAIYPFSIGTLFFVATPWLLFLSNFSSMALLWYASSILLALYLLTWPLVLGMGVGGYGIAGLCYQWYAGMWPSAWAAIGTDPTCISWSHFWMGLVLFLSFVVLFWHRQRRQHRWQRHTRAVEREQVQLKKKYDLFCTQLNGLHRDFEMTYKQDVKGIEEDLAKLEKKPTAAGIKKLEARMSNNMAYAHKFMDQVQTQMVLQYDHMKLTDFLENWKTLYKDLSKMAPIAVQNNCPRDTEVVWDRYRLYDLLQKLCQIHFAEDRDRLILMTAVPTKLHYSEGDREMAAVALVVQQGFGVHQVKQVRSRYTFIERSEGKVANELTRAIEAHYGVLEKSKDEALVLVLPQTINRIRPTMAQDGHALPKTPPSPMAERHAKSVESAFWQLILEKLPKSSNKEFENLKRALLFMKHYHGPVQRKTGDLYYTHPMAVAMKVIPYTPHITTWIGALLHDVLEDTHSSLEEIGAAFGPEVQELVRLVSSMRLTGKKYKLEHKEEQAELLLKCQNREAQLIKLCDRLDNVETLEVMTPAKRKKKCEETKAFFIPLAKQLGLPDVVQTLEKACQKWDMKKQK